MHCVSINSAVYLSLVLIVSPAHATSPAPAAEAAPIAPMPGAPAQAAPPRATGIPVPAVWKERHIDFYYVGRTARYSCDGLRDKLRAMLFDLGARRDLKIVATGCADDDRLRVNSGVPSLTVIFSAPALPDPSMKPLHEGDLAATDARFETFTITSDAFRNLGVGDCEFVEDFRQQILPALVTRRVKDDIRCRSDQPSGNHFLLKGEILRPLPRAAQRIR